MYVFRMNHIYAVYNSGITSPHHTQNPTPLSMEALSIPPIPKYVRVVMLVKEYKAMTKIFCCKTNLPMDVLFESI